MSSAPTERPAWRSRLAAPRLLWLGPEGLWDHGSPPRWWQGRPWRRAAGQSAAAQPHASFDAWCQAHPGQACQLLLSGWLLHELLLDPQLPLADDTARLACGRGLLQHYHGEAALQWPLAAWQAAGRHGISALHAMPLVALQASARQAGVALQAVRPWWSQALAMAWQLVPALARASSARLLVVDGTLLTQVNLEQGRLQQLQQRRLADARPDSLRSWHAGQPAVACSLAIGHGLAGAWPGNGGDGLQLLASLQGQSPAALWVDSGVHALAVAA